MFERKNQSILTPHYSALVAHDDDLAANNGDGDDDVFTLARRDHALSDEEDGGVGELDGEEAQLVAAVTGGSQKEAQNQGQGKAPEQSQAQTKSQPLISSEDLSKRKLKLASSKKGAIRLRSGPEKLVFDDETGEAREFYQAGQEIEQASGDVKARQEFLEKERERMKIEDRVDRQVAREKKQELKRKRKEKEKEVSVASRRLPAIRMC